ncbi:hypothetical protein ACFYQA_34525 [Streptomyces sp. NPDC005774]|uniref:hypothetical protein n=1 Tax=Streptomyces sp. NPDC005774 TaxID=3364728 RepID=UPI0036C393FE
MTGGSCNSYDYVCGDPVNLLDLDGRMTALALVGAAGLGVSAGTVLAIIGVGAVIGIAALIWLKGKAWAVKQVKILWAKASKKSGKERATDAPSFVRGKSKIPGKSAEQSAIEYFKRAFGRPPTKREKGAGGPISKAKKYFDRK